MSSHPFSLAGRRVLVTGAASGLGRAFALAMAEAGAAVACADIDPGAEATAAAIAARGGTALFLPVDVAEEASVATLPPAVERGFGGLDVLVNNAGIAIPPGRLLDLSVRDWDRVMAVNLRGVFLCSRALLPLLLAGSDPAVINISSFLGQVGLYPGFPITALPYAASKAGVDGFTRQLAIEYARDGLRVNAIAPGWHGGTALGRERRASTTPAERERHEAFLRQSIPMGHRGTPEDITGLAVFLAGPASRYVTGQVFAHDGGLTAT
ncbi:SDR family NAD(P)-dependent oxidoreductase [Roseomonas sp. BN140053]|uniref:SDR family NAD(P)-dependent oxidoreductase n=1 Tax=Roseomonas sp. BN140053 TaxID=3391898 RepID=UPI0039E99F58